MSEFEDLDRWANQGVQPQQAQTPGPEAIPEGSYDFEIVGAELGRTQKNPETIFRLGLRVLGGSHSGVTLERPTFFRRQESLDYLAGDLLTLGFSDVAQWNTGGRRFSDELKQACKKLIGLRFRGQRKDGETDQGKKFHNLYVVARLVAGSGSTPTPVPAPTTTPPMSSEPLPF